MRHATHYFHPCHTYCSFLCVTWLIHVCHMALSLCYMVHSCVSHGSFMCVTWRVHTYRYAYEAELEAKRSRGSGAAAAPVEPVLFDTGLQPGGIV